MLETVLQIGKAFRESPNGLKWHRYIKPCPIESEKETRIILQIPVNSSFEFDLNKVSILTNENEQNRLFCFQAKTADRDNQIRYIFGDIHYTPFDEKKGRYRNDSFENSESYFQEMLSLQAENLLPAAISITKFRENYRKQKESIEKILKYGYLVHKEGMSAVNILAVEEAILFQKMLLLALNDVKNRKNATQVFKRIFKAENVDEHNISTFKMEMQLELIKQISHLVFLHFDFEGKHWYELDQIMNFANRKILEDFTQKEENGVTLKKYIYKTLSSGDKDAQFPNFKVANKTAAKTFESYEQFFDLLYAIDYSQTAKITPFKTDIKIIVLPRQTEKDTIKALTYANFLHSERSLKGIIDAERAVKFDTGDSLFLPFLSNAEDESASIKSFDVIFSKSGGVSSPDVDLIEIVGLEKSALRQIAERIRKIQSAIYEERKPFYKEDLKPLSIVYSFLNLLGTKGKEQKKYQSHLYKVLPQIYTATYYRDPILLPIFIEKCEMDIRDGNPSFNLLKFDFYFLTSIQNTQEDNLMKITESPSYQLGLKLGLMARPLKKAINSFEKNFVGNLRRRTSDLPSLIAFSNFINEKLTIHNKYYQNLKTEWEACTLQIAQFEGVYNKEEFAFGFFESYFKYILKASENPEEQSDSLTDGEES